MDTVRLLEPPPNPPTAPPASLLLAPPPNPPTTSRGSLLTAPPPNPPAGTNRGGLVALRLVFGFGLALFCVVMVFTSAETTDRPIDCGGPAIRVAFGYTSPAVPASRRAECQTEGTDQTVGGLVVFGVPAVLLLLGPGTRRLWRSVRDRAGPPLPTSIDP